MRRHASQSDQRILAVTHPIWMLVMTVVTASSVTASSGSALMGAETAPKSADRSKASAATQTARDGLRRGIAGDLDARSDALQRAIELDRSCQLARWHQGQIQFDDRWLSVEQAARKFARDLDFREYDRLRDQVIDQPDGDLVLADWCKQHGLPAAERLHLYRVLQNATHTPTRNQAIRRLGLRNYRGMLLPPETIKALERQAATYQDQLDQWTETVQKWAEGLANGRARQREYIRQQVRDEVDATAIPALEQVFSVRSEPLALDLITFLGNLPQHEATVALVRQSVVSDWPSVRKAAAKQLKRRPRHDYVPLLLQQLGSPIQTRYAVNVGPDGLVRHRHVFYREGAEANHIVEASYVGGPVFVPQSFRTVRGARFPGKQGDAARKELADLRAQHQTRLLKAQFARQLIAAQESIRSVRMEQEVGLANQQLAAINQVVFEALEDTTGELTLDKTPESWWDWWQGETETYRDDKPTYEHKVGVVNPYYVPYVHVTLMSCFPAGTKIRTLEGMKNIEEIQVGDRVLSQDVESGELAFKIVLQTTERPPSDLLEIGLGDSTVTATKGHPLWVNGIGWRMAKQLQPGDQIHSLDGGSTVDRVELAPPAAAYNLVVADFNTYFVGSAQLLAHDNTYRKPTRALTPGLLRDPAAARR